jgi:hypothetical protein
LDGELVSTYKGTVGASVNIEGEFQRYLGLNQSKLKRYLDFRTYAFFDAGIINLSEIDEYTFAKPRFDAGLGAALKIKRFYHFETVKPLTIRMDFPIYLSRTPNVNPRSLSLKWIIGINRAF